MVENAWTIDRKIHCTKKSPPDLAERDCPRKIHTSNTSDDLFKLGVTRLILKDLVLQSCFAFRNPMGV